jgi:signal transduction histidine kinase
MRFRRSLRHRVVLAFALFGGAVSLLLAVGLYVATLDLQNHLVDDALTAELDDYVARLRAAPNSLPPATVTVRGYVDGNDGRGAEIPVDLRALGPGRYKAVLGGHIYRVAVADREGWRLHFLYDESRILLWRRYFVAYLAVGVLLMVLMSAAGALWLAGIVISPVTELAQRVRGLGPEGTARAVGEDFPRDEVGELAAACDRYLQRLRGFIERERAFTADVSHELRTPLAVVKGAAEVLEGDGGLSERARDRISRIDRAAEEMSDITSALLLLAREEVAAPPHTPCAIEAVLRDVVEKHRYLLEGKPVDLALTVEGAQSLPVERTLLAIALGNLVRNAFMYTHRGLIRIRLDCAGLSIEDTGTGMAEEAVARAFERYYRRGAGHGEGIGLSLVKRICDRYGWDVSMSSKEGQGTVVRLGFLPAHPRVADAVPPASGLPAEFALNETITDS